MTKKISRPQASAHPPRTRTSEILLSASAAARLLEQGPETLSDAELLSLLLRTDERTTPHDEGVRLLAKHGSLRDLLLSDPRTSSQLSPRNFIILKAALELARRHYRQTMMSSPALVSSDAIHQFVRAQLRDRNYEVFCCVFLDNQMRVREFTELFRGSVSASTVYIAEVARVALSRNATGVIAVHNHPTGSAEPSMSDRAVTMSLRAALSLIEIPLLDHLIVADDGFISFAERGFL